MNLEDDLRNMLRERASTFIPSARPSSAIAVRARRRAAKRLFATGLVILVALGLGATVVGKMTPGERAFAAVNVRQLQDRTADVAPADGHAPPGQSISLPRLEEHVQCLRTHGLNLPDPVKTAEGWQVIVEEAAPLPSESPDPAVRKSWAQAVFVDCRLLDATGDLVLGGRSRGQIDGLMTCAQSKGFVLPEPKEIKPSEFVFDLNTAAPRWGSQAWYETVFVTCGLWRSSP
jgi:hypothetical protein